MIIKLLGVIFSILLLAGCNTIVENQSGDKIVDETEIIKVAEFNSMNWGLVDGSSDYWDGEYYTLYNDGTCEYFELYNLTGKKNETSFKIPKDKLEKIVKDLEWHYRDTNLNAVDGTGWKFSVFGMNGTENKVSEAGYIYGTKLEKIIEEIDTYRN